MTIENISKSAFSFTFHYICKASTSTVDRPRLQIKTATQCRRRGSDQNELLFAADLWDSKSSSKHIARIRSLVPHEIPEESTCRRCKSKGFDHCSRRHRDCNDGGCPRPVRESSESAFPIVYVSGVWLNYFVC